MIRPLLWIVAALVGAALIYLAFVLPARAHEWYAPSCCSGQDCAPLPAGAVTWSEGRWHVRLTPGQHPMLPDAPFSGAATRALPSQDDRFHGCISPGEHGEAWLICLYVPQLGV